MWYWRPSGWESNNHKPWDIETIRKTYGSDVVDVQLKLELDKELGIVETSNPKVANLRIVPLLDKGLKTTIVRGQETPIVQGWLPRGHGIRGVRPIPTVVYQHYSAKLVRFLTILQPLRDGSEDRVSAVFELDDKVKAKYSSGKTVDMNFPPKK